MPTSIQKSSDLPICYSTEQKTSLWFIKINDDGCCVVQKFIADDCDEINLFKVIETKLYQLDCGKPCCRYYIKMSTGVRSFRFNKVFFDKYISFIQMSLDLDIPIETVKQIVESVDAETYVRLKTIQDFHDNAFRTMNERSGEYPAFSV